MPFVYCYRNQSPRTDTKNGLTFDILIHVIQSVADHG